MEKQNKNNDLFAYHRINCLEDGRSTLNDFASDPFQAFCSAGKRLSPSRGDFFPYRLQQFLSFRDGSLNHFFAGGHIFHQPDGLAHGQNPGF